MKKILSVTLALLSVVFVNCSISYAQDAVQQAESSSEAPIAETTGALDTLVSDPAATPVAASAETDIDAGMSDTENVDYVYGTVVSVNPQNSEIVISEYNWDDGSEVNKTYVYDGATAFENVNSGAEITAGSDIDIEFESRDNKNIAKYVTVYPIEDDTEL